MPDAVRGLDGYRRIYCATGNGFGNIFSHIGRGIQFFLRKALGLIPDPDDAEGGSLFNGGGENG